MFLTRWLQLTGRLTADPFPGIRTPRVETPLVHPLTEDELRALLRTCQPDADDAAPDEALHHRRDEEVSLPPTLDEAIRIVRRQHASITVGELADAVIAKGWNVERDVLIERIRQLFPPRPLRATPGPSAAPTAPAAQENPKGTTRGVRDSAPQKRKRPKSEVTRDYCPKCHAFVVMTRLNGVTTVAEHLNRKNERRCAQSGKSYTPTPLLRPDALLSLHDAGPGGWLGSF